MKYLSQVLFLCLTSAVIHAQEPAPIVVQAVTPGNHSAPAVATPPPSSVAEATHALDLLQQMQAANADLLKKQQATLAALDELQKAADELKIFSKRG